MLDQTSHDRPTLRDLGDGLILRATTIEDAEALAAQQAIMHSEGGPDKPDETIRAWVLDLMSGNHPTFKPSDFTVVEDTRTKQIVSAVGLISQTWTYGGIPFKVGQPELVATNLEYQRRGLVRAQFEVIHEWSAQRGELVQAITGIPWYYRQFGYEMGLPMHGGRVGYLPHVPKLEGEQGETYTLRAATDGDISFVSEMYRRAEERSLVASVRDEKMWHYDLHGHREASTIQHQVRVIETAENGEPVGLLVHPSALWGPASVATVFELKDGVSWLSVSASVVRYLVKTGQEYAARSNGEFEAFGFFLGSEHPCYAVLSERLPRVRAPYAWYVRVPDLPGFLSHIAPVLERRLSKSPLSGYAGEQKLNFFRSGLRLEFKEGKLVTSEAWNPASANDGNTSFPDLTFLQMVFGYRNMEDLDYAFADVTARSIEARLLLSTLFPKQVSNVWPIG